MWITCFGLSIGSLMAAAAILIITSNSRCRFNVFNTLFAGVLGAVFFVFIPIHIVKAEPTILGIWKTLLLSVFNTIQVFASGCEFGIVTESIGYCPEELVAVYQVWVAVLYVLAPVFTFGFVLSLFKNFSAKLRYFGAYFRDVYIFSELNDKSLTLAADIKSRNKKSVIVFTDVFKGNEEKKYELIESAKKLGAICFRKDILVIDFKKHSSKKAIYFFTIGENETENLNQSLKLIDLYRQRDNTHIYAFSTRVESELLLTAVDKGKIRVRRINEVQSLISRTLYERGEIIFDSAKESSDGLKHISAVVVGMGCHGTEMVKALAWYGQMDGYSLEINAFDKDPLAEEKFVALAPELMSAEYNGVSVMGEAQYKITVHSGVDVDTITFVNEIAEINNATYVMVALGSDDVNIKTAVNLRMYFERMKIHPVIQAIVHNSQQKKALQGIRNYRGQEYDTEFIGDMESSYTENVIMDSELEEEALRRHLKWGNEDEFWNYEYNYRSSIASVIHIKARINRGIPGAAKTEDELTVEERSIIESLEHRRWNAYMRAEGYVFSGSKDKSSRNDLAKMHHDLVDFASLSDEEKRKDSQTGIN